ncbi:glycosyltransferase [Shouchella sp. JSM 1781072]|uniref:CgeB family protein n=1 Tax=Shouchella sp. JSM 1781072 TaxID=3344581 RepID=UPI0035C0D93E
MNILLLKAPYGGIYSDFERSLTKGLRRHCTVVDEPYNRFKNNRLVSFCRQHQIDWIITFNGYFFSKDEKELFCAGHLPPLAVWLTEDPYYVSPSMDILSIATKAWSVDTAAVDLYRQQHQYDHVDFLPLGFEEDWFYPAESSPLYDLVFAGYPYENRVKWLHAIAKNIDLTLAIVGPWRPDQCPPNAYHKATWLAPKEIGAFYRQAKMVLNSYRTAHDGIMATSINNRTFDIAASQACQLSEYREGIETFFPNQEIVTFTDTSQLLHAVQTLLNDSDLRKDHAYRSRQRIHGHRFSDRAYTIYKELESR